MRSSSGIVGTSLGGAAGLEGAGLGGTTGADGMVGIGLIGSGTTSYDSYGRRDGTVERSLTDGT